MSEGVCQMNWTQELQYARYNENIFPEIWTFEENV